MTKNILLICASLFVSPLTNANTLRNFECSVAENPEIGLVKSIAVKISAGSGGIYSLSLNDKQFSTKMVETAVSNQQAIEATLGLLKIPATHIASMTVIEEVGSTPELKFFTFWNAQKKFMTAALLIDGMTGGICK